MNTLLDALHAALSGALGTALVFIGHLTWICGIIVALILINYLGAGIMHLALWLCDVAYTLKHSRTYKLTRERRHARTNSIC